MTARLEALIRHHHTSVLVRTLVTFLAITAAATLATGLIAERLAARRISEQIAESSARFLESKQRITDEMIVTLGTLLNQLVYHPSVFRIVSLESRTTEFFLTARNIIANFNSIISANDLIDSIYLFDSAHDFVLAGALYEKKEFTDIEFLVNPPDDVHSVVGPRSLGGGQVFSFVRRLDLFTRDTIAYVVVNVGADELLKEFTPPAGPTHSLMRVHRSDGSVVFPAGADGRAVSTPPSLVPGGSRSGIPTVRVAGDEYLVFRKHSNTLDWTYVYLRRYKDAIAAALLVRRLILVSLGGIVTISAIAVSFFSSRFYRPVRSLAMQARRLGGTGDEPRDEYDEIENAFRNLISRNTHLRDRVSTLLPFFRRHSIHDLIVQREIDPGGVELIEDLLGVHLDRNGFWVVALGVMSEYDSEDLCDEIERATASLDGWRFVVSEERPGRIVILVNSDFDDEHLAAAVRRLRAGITVPQPQTFVATSDRFTTISDLRVAYEVAMRRLEYRCFVEEEAISQRAVGDRSAELDPDADLLAYTSAVKAQDAVGAATAIVRYAGRNTRSPRPALVSTAAGGSICGVDDAEVDVSVLEVRYRYLRLAWQLDVALRDVGVPMTDYGLDAFSMYRTIESAPTATALNESFIEVTHTAIGAVADLSDTRRSDIVNRVAAFLDQHYDTNLSLEQIAEQVFLSPRYLSAVFKEQRGETIYEYLTRRRMQVAGELLLASNDLVGDVARQTGFQSVHSFIRRFKDQFGVTPGQYRRARARIAPANDGR